MVLFGPQINPVTIDRSFSKHLWKMYSLLKCCVEYARSFIYLFVYFSQQLQQKQN